MEKIILSNQTEHEISGISDNGNSLDIRFNGGDFAALEIAFENPEVLEKIILIDADGNAMAAFKNYAILNKITKEKNVMIDDINDVTVDVVTVTLEKEPEWVVSQRRQDTRLASVEETADILVMNALGGENNHV